MSLSTYHQKRHFDRTPEPKGRQTRKKSAVLQFTVQKHDASRLHYDFRLEVDGVLKSWAVPKGPSLDPDHKSLAVQVEDHPIDYGDFEGVIPKGEYGGGTVLLWDTGTWEPLHDPAEGIASGKLHFILHGKKLKGEWSLVQMHGKAGDDGKNWLLMKLNDQHSSKKSNVLSDQAESVKTSRSIEQIAGDRDKVWSGDAKEISKLIGVEKSAFPTSFSPQLALLAEAPPTGEQWLHEIKYDGYRFQARIRNQKVQLITRNGKDWTAKFPGVTAALAKLKVDSAIIDGEIVVLDAEGRSDFEALQRSLKAKEAAEPVLFAFDLLYCDGFDLRETPLLERKQQLERILNDSQLAPRINYSEHVLADGSAVVDKACEMALEGIISKKVDATYVSRRDTSWVKSKCGHRQEFVVIGYTDPQGARSGFGSLLLGYHDDKKQLVYAGRVGTGFDDKLLKSTLKQLHVLKQAKSPTDVMPPSRELRDAHWVKPSLVAEVNFTGWTSEGVLRHPAFIAFRSDKPAGEIVREIPVTPAKLKSLASKATAGKKNAPKPRKEPASKRKVATKSQSAPSGSGNVRLTHPDKVLFPDSGTTKQQIADYYTSVEEWLLPNVIDRPLALVRCPGGVGSKCFFQRNWSNTLPAAIGKVDVSEGKKSESHVTVHDLSGILSMVQMSVLEIHTWGCKNAQVERPDHLIFDLDPGPDLSWKRIVEAARIVRETLESLHLPTFIKTSGGKGFHITIPIQPNIDWDSAKSFCATIAHSLAESSDLFVANMRKDLRGGKVYLDYNRNGRSATAVAPYSTRARAGAPVSMPILWEELRTLKSADQFKVGAVAKYLSKRKKDPWADFEKARVDLFKVIGRKSAA